MKGDKEIKIRVFGKSKKKKKSKNFPRGVVKHILWLKLFSFIIQITQPFLDARFYNFFPNIERSGARTTMRSL